MGLSFNLNSFFLFFCEPELIYSLGLTLVLRFLHHSIRCSRHFPQFSLLRHRTIGTFAFTASFPLPSQLGAYLCSSWIRERYHITAVVKEIFAGKQKKTKKSPFQIGMKSDFLVAGQASWAAKRHRCLVEQRKLGSMPTWNEEIS